MIVCSPHLSHLLKQRLLLLVPSTGIHNDEIPPLLAEALDSLLRNNGRVALLITPVEWDLGLGGVLLQLVKGSCSEGVLQERRADIHESVNAVLHSNSAPQGVNQVT